MTAGQQNHIYEARAVEPDGRQRSFGARHTHAEAESLLRESIKLYQRANYERYWIEEIDTSDLFQIPTRPTPRERFTARVQQVTSPPGTWPTVHVYVVDTANGDAVVASYDRNYTMLQTFEPFRQGERMFALVSTHYTATSVLDLHTGEIIAAESPDSFGFCPVGFYVPDWWDLHDGTVLPGTLSWRPADHEWPCGDFGFVWGCVWGDDTSWKVQHLDLSAVRDGEIRRDDRFGYSSSPPTPNSNPSTSSASSPGKVNAVSSSTSRRTTTSPPARRSPMKTYDDAALSG